jgi:ornithine cyclodeaminase
MQEGAIDRAHIAAELAEVVSGRHPGRRRHDEITVFKSVGFALEDLATAELAWRLATEHGAGTRVSL